MMSTTNLENFFGIPTIGTETCTDPDRTTKRLIQVFLHHGRASDAKLAHFTDGYILVILVHNPGFKRRNRKADGTGTCLTAKRILHAGR